MALERNAEFAVDRALQQSRQSRPSPFQNSTEPHSWQKARRPVSLERYHLSPRASLSLKCSSFTAVDDM
jgi:hypothetical protein